MPDAPAAAPAAPTPAVAAPAAAAAPAPAAVATPAPAVPAPAAGAPAAPPVAAAPAPAATDQPPAPIVLKLPDGALVDAKHAEAVATFAKERGLKADVAQAVLERENAAAQAVLAAKQQEFNHTATVTWVEQAKADTEIGGAKFEASKADAHRALGKFAAPAFAKMLNETGWGNHPEVLRTFARIGQAMRDDGMSPPRADGPSGPTEEQLLRQRYPSMAAAAGT